MCEYCENGKNIELESDSAKSYWFIINRNRIARLYCKMGESQLGNCYGIEINNCPMCGRKLSETEDTEEMKEVTHAHAIVDWLGNPKCSNCGSKNIDVTELYCQHCGASFDETEEREG